MKAIKLLPVLLVAMMMMVAACGKTAMENQSSSDPEPRPVVRTEPEPQAVEPAPEPRAKHQAPDGREEFISTHVYFDFDSAVLRSEAQDLLRIKAQWLLANSDIASVVIEGHCDERGTDAYNLALGARRAEAVKQYLADMGVDSVRLGTLSYGEEKPANPGKNEAAWAMNRRACFVINE